MDKSARARSILPIAVPTAALAWLAISGVYRKLGHPGATLDDAFIHFQYARAFAELHPFRFEVGEPFTTGATSFAWPAVLAPFYALGFRDVAILWPAWILSFLALGLLAHETHELTRPLAGRAAAVGAAAMVLAFSGFSWCAASGMEVVPFAWVLARAARRSSEWSEWAGADPQALGRRRVEILALAVLAPLVRPEGGLASWMIAATLLVFPRSPKRWAGRAPGLVAVLGPAVPLLLAYALTGSVRTSTSIAKLLPGNPYYAGPVLRDAVLNNVRLLVGTLLNGEQWSAEFLPRAGAGVAVAGVMAIALRGWQAGTRWRAACILGLALGMAIPCLYVTFLWNRLRYLWPFATGLCIGLACLARVIGDACARVSARWSVATPLLCGGFVGALAVHQGWALDDVADSASGIDRQQVALGRWAKENLPADARIGVNDTGAVAYLSERHTFDIVGLTTRSEARYWVAGAASRFEHYERLLLEAPKLLPTHFIVYPEWMACDAVLGATLFEATVTDATILGGTTMRVYEADYTKLGSGESPWTQVSPIVDRVDVADLESESAHGYDLHGARDGEEVVRTGFSPDGHEVVDGGRGARTIERFVARLRGPEAYGIVRLEAPDKARIHVRVGRAGAEKDAGVFDTHGDAWHEYVFALPGDFDGPTVVELSSQAPLTVYHYWFVAKR